MSSVLDWHEIALISNIWYRTFCQAGRGLVRHTYLLPLSKLASAPSSHRCGSLRNILLLSPHLSIGYLRPSLWQCPLYSLLFDTHHCQGLQRCEAADRQPTDLFWLDRAKMGQLHIKAEFLTSFKKKWMRWQHWPFVLANIGWGGTVAAPSEKKSSPACHSPQKFLLTCTCPLPSLMLPARHLWTSAFSPWQR